MDDEPSIGKVLVRMLGDEHEAVTVASGAKAKELLADDHQFDGIICDLMMPEVTGMDLHAWVEREHPELARNMIFATGGAFTPRSREFLNRVRNPRINKPIDRKNLLGWLRKMVEPEHSSSMRDGA